MFGLLTVVLLQPTAAHIWTIVAICRIFFQQGSDIIPSINMLTEEVWWKHSVGENFILYVTSTFCSYPVLKQQQQRSFQNGEATKKIWKN